MTTRNLTQQQLSKASKDIRRASRIIRTVWLALDSPIFDASDTTDVSNTLCEGFELLLKVRELADLAVEAEADADQRAASRSATA